MAQSDALRGAFEKTYAAHVFNSMHAAMSFDLVRAVGALILDRRKNTASLYRAVGWLRKPIVIEQLRSNVYGRTAHVKRIDADDINAVLERIHRTEFDATFDRVPAQLDEIKTKILVAPVANIIEDIRNKTVAHSAVEHDGSDWKLWAVMTGAKLTYGQLDAYIDVCTPAVEALCHLVLRTSFPFDDLPGIHQRYVEEFIGALVIGLNEQKQTKERKREENQKRMRDILGPAVDPGDTP